MIYSRFNKRLSLNQQRCAITLLCTKGSYFNQHTEIAIEGVNKKNQYYLKIAHLVGTSLNYNNNIICGFLGSAGKVKLTCVRNPDKLKYHSKTDTWLRPRPAVKKMLHVIKLEQNNSQLAPRFHILGRHSVFAKPLYLQAAYFASLWRSITSFSFFYPMLWLVCQLISRFCLALQAQPVQQHCITDNCFTWAREKLKYAEIILPEKQSEGLFVSIQQYTNAPTFIAMVP